MRTEFKLKKTIPFAGMVALVFGILLFTSCGKDDVVEVFPPGSDPGTEKYNTFSGDYAYDENHSDIAWGTQYAGTNGELRGQFETKYMDIDFDEANPTACKIEAVVVMSTCVTGEGRDGLGNCLHGYLEVVHNGDTLPDGSLDPAGVDPASDSAWFVSTKVEVYGDGYRATGNFTFLGVTAEEVLYFDYTGYTEYGDPITRKAGFGGTLTFLSRTTYGLAAGTTYDLTADEVRLDLALNIKKTF